MVNHRDFASGLIVAAFGAFFAVRAFLDLPIGTTFRMGPGYFPAAVGLLVIGLGLAIAMAGLRNGPAEKLSPIRLRGILFIALAILVFLFTVRGAGLVPAVAAAVVLARLADPESGLVGTLVLAAALCAFCAAVFVYGVGLPIPVFGTWWGLP